LATLKKREGETSSSIIGERGNRLTQFYESEGRVVSKGKRHRFHTRMRMGKRTSSFCPPGEEKEEVQAPAIWREEIAKPTKVDRAIPRATRKKRKTRPLILSEEKEGGLSQIHLNAAALEKEKVEHKGRHVIAKEILY